jgi:ankyrin repeat protein
MKKASSNLRSLLLYRAVLDECARGPANPFYRPLNINRSAVGEMLLGASADLEAMTSWGATALDWAATMAGRKLRIYSWYKV